MNNYQSILALQRGNAGQLDREPLERVKNCGPLSKLLPVLQDPGPQAPPLRDGGEALEGRVGRAAQGAQRQGRRTAIHHSGSAPSAINPLRRVSLQVAAKPPQAEFNADLRSV